VYERAAPEWGRREEGRKNTVRRMGYKAVATCARFVPASMTLLDTLVILNQAYSLRFLQQNPWREHQSGAMHTLYACYTRIPDSSAISTVSQEPMVFSSSASAAAFSFSSCMVVMIAMEYCNVRAGNALYNGSKRSRRREQSLAKVSEDNFESFWSSRINQSN